MTEEHWESQKSPWDKFKVERNFAYHRRCGVILPNKRLNNQWKSAKDLMIVWIA